MLIKQPKRVLITVPGSAKEPGIFIWRIENAFVCSSPRAYNGTGDSMPQSSHERVAEFHNQAAHAHTAAAVAHGKGDHLSAHELSRQAHEHSMNAHKLSEELAAQHAPAGKK